MSRRVAWDVALVLRALLCTDSVAQRLRQSWQHRHCVPLVQASHAQRLIRALAYPGWGLSATQQQELLADFLPYAEVVNTQVTPRAGLDPAQAELLALALQGEADCWVSNDADLQQWASRARAAEVRRLGPPLSVDEGLALLLG
ncbi:PIN domain nuclease [Roseateles sp. BYS180W]|uniref:PIN domain nuclease n=1 Tax=Roseateles rivi TaxID=3299028 RepID=A0ABW7FTW9_9BURK